jgi:ABC-type Fe3+-hydroxamate transport system substrate-binding protein
VAELIDDLGRPVDLPHPPRRIVSLVPSLTESVAGTGRLVGATDWCTHPAGLDVTRVRGTKNPDRAAIAALRPDLVLANKEENRQLDVDRLTGAGIPVWVTDIRTVEAALASLSRLFAEVLDLPRPDWLDAATDAFAPAPARRRRVAVPIWRDPWMVVGPDTFTGDLLARLGLDNVFDTGDDRYPHTTPDDISARSPEVVLLPDEPYAFSADDGPEAFPHAPTALVEGRAITWYGPSLADAPAVVAAALP